jgi:hypothetical protein
VQEVPMQPKLTATKIAAYNSIEKALRSELQEKLK